MDAYDACLRRHAVKLPDAAPIRLAQIEVADAQVLGDAVAGSADVFVTGDRARLALGSRAPVTIVSLRQLWVPLRDIRERERIEGLAG